MKRLVLVAGLVALCCETNCNNVVVAMDPTPEQKQRIDGSVNKWLLNNIAKLKTEEQIIAVADQIIPDVLKAAGVTDSIEARKQILDGINSLSPNFKLMLTMATIELPHLLHYVKYNNTLYALEQLGLMVKKGDVYVLDISYKNLIDTIRDKGDATWNAVKAEVVRINGMSTADLQRELKLIFQDTPKTGFIDSALSPEFINDVTQNAFKKLLVVKALKQKLSLEAMNVQVDETGADYANGDRIGVHKEWREFYEWKKSNAGTINPYQEEIKKQKIIDLTHELDHVVHFNLGIVPMNLSFFNGMSSLEALSQKGTDPLLKNAFTVFDNIKIEKMENGALSRDWGATDEILTEIGLSTSYYNKKPVLIIDNECENTVRCVLNKPYRINHNRGSEVHSSSVSAASKAKYAILDKYYSGLTYNKRDRLAQQEELGRLAAQRLVQQQEQQERERQARLAQQQAAQRLEQERRQAAQRLAAQQQAAQRLEQERRQAEQVEQGRQFKQRLEQEQRQRQAAQRRRQQQEQDQH